MADIHGSPGDAPQMPQNVTSSGPAPVPYAGADQSPEPPDYGVELGPMAPADGYVLHGAVNLGTTPVAGAYDIASANMGVSGTADAPYYPGPLSPIYTGGDDDAGGRSPVAGTVADSVANATARLAELQSDTFKQGPVVGTAVQGQAGPQQGSVIGDLVQFPPVGEDPGAGVGNTLPTLGFYDPPRDYGGAAGAPGYANTGNEPPPRGQQGAAQ